MAILWCEEEGLLCTRSTEGNEEEKKVSGQIACRLYGAHDLRIEPLPPVAPDAGEAIIRVLRGGICGSDLHYYQDGGFGPVRVRDAIILGHEASGIVEAAPEGSRLQAGQLVSLCPSRPCGECRYCLEGSERHCSAMRFSGSAMRLPHEDGFFRNRLSLPATQCFPHADGISAEAAAGAEPLAVCLHALGYAGDLAGKAVLITGAGPIGAICTALAKRAGAVQIIVTDVQDYTLAVAARMGATRVVNVARDSAGLDDLMADKGRIDVVFECSANAQAIATAIAALRPMGCLVQIGVAGSTAVPLNLIVGKEIRFHGTHRFDGEFAEAVALISSGGIDLSPMVSAVLPAHQAVEAFALASDRARSVKVQLDFTA